MGNYLTFTAETSDLKPFITAGSLDNALVDIDGETAKIEAVNVDIDSSESEVDSYLGKQYTVPLTNSPTPPVVVDAAGVLTAERIYNRGSGGPQTNIDRAVQIRAWLKDVAAGKATIPDVTQSPSTSVGSGVVIVDAETRQLTRAKLGFLST